MILRHFPRNYKISVDLRPSSISTRLLSPTTLVLFREISRKKVRRQRRHHLLSQIYGDKSSQHYYKMRLLRLIFKGWFWSGIVSRIRWFSSESGLTTGRHESWLAGLVLEWRWRTGGLPLVSFSFSQLRIWDCKYAKKLNSELLEACSYDAWRTPTYYKVQVLEASQPRAGRGAMLPTNY